MPIGADEFDQYTVGAFGVDETVHEEGHAPLLTYFQDLVQVIHLDGKVVNPFPPFIEEALDQAVLAPGFQELKKTFTHRDYTGKEIVGFQGVIGHFRTENRLQEIEYFVDIFYREPYVMPDLS